MLINIRQFLGFLGALVVVSIAALPQAHPAVAKTPGATYCFLRVCHRVLTLAETETAVGRPASVIASHYDLPERDRYNPSATTSSGEIFRALDADNAASPIYPDGTVIGVVVPESGRAAIVRINNAGPYYSGRLLDLSRGLAERLGIAEAGVARVYIEVLAAPQPWQTRYVFGRRYDPVPGYIGVMSGLEAVRGVWSNPGRWPSGLAAAVGAGLQPPPARVRTASLSAAGSAKRQGVVLRPAKQRRPHLTAIVARRVAAKAGSRLR
jgi:hypothetical protein